MKIILLVVKSCSGTYVKSVMQYYVYTLHHNSMEYVILPLVLIVSGNRPLVCFGRI